MCGIIGYTGQNEAVDHLLEGLFALEYRGYDSAGIALPDENGGIVTVKAAGKLQMLADKVKASSLNLSAHCGIGHTRWATHGSPNDINAHPHGTGRVAIVHNGIIENHMEIRGFLAKNGYVFRSETDTEAAALLLDLYDKQTGDPLAAMQAMTAHLKGSYAIAALFAAYPDTLFAARKDNPLVVAKGDCGSFLASDIPAFLAYTDTYFHLEEGEVAVLKPDGITVFNGEERVDKVYEKAEFDRVAAEKNGYPHFMIKEIHEEPEALINTVRPRVKDGMPVLEIPELTDERLCAFKRIRVVACGTAMHAGLVGKYAVEKLARVPVTVDIASEFRYAEPILDKDDLVIVVSQSGETADTIAAMRLATEKGAYTLAVVNVVGSTIAREAAGVLYTHAGPEIAVASTKAYSVQLAVLYLFALRFAFAKKTLSEEAVKAYTAELMTRVPAAVGEVLADEEILAAAAQSVKDEHDVFFIGRGVDYPCAVEAALKLKEISYLHAEAYAAGELKHGTISLITAGTPVFAPANDRTLLDKTQNNIIEVRSRGGHVILLSSLSEALEADCADTAIKLPQVSALFSPIVTATATQTIAYYAALYLGHDVDKPRNLAKSVTVE